MELEYGNFHMELSPLVLKEQEEESDSDDFLMNIGLNYEYDSDNNLILDNKVNISKDIVGNNSDITSSVNLNNNAGSSTTPIPVKSAETEKEKEANTKPRFKDISEDDIKKYEDLFQSESTKKNTKWALKIFQDWHTDKYGAKFKFEKNQIDKDSLAGKIGKFYCSAKPKPSDKSSSSSNENYHKNTLKNIRAAINRHLSDIGSDIDIVNDKAFKSTNRILDGLLKERLKQGASKPTQHKIILESSDLKKISEYFENLAELSPIILRQYIWYIIAIHYVTRGLEFHFQLTSDSFGFAFDADGLEYAYLASISTKLQS